MSVGVTNKSQIMDLVQIFDSVNNELLKVILPSGVAEKCRRDVEFATDFYKRINHSLAKTNNQSSTFQSNGHLNTESVSNENALINSAVEEKLDTDGWFRKDLLKFLKILQKFKSRLKNPDTRDETWPLISKELATLGVFKSVAECSKKWSILLQTHKFIADKSNPRWQYFKEFSHVLNGDCNDGECDITKDNKTAPKKVKFFGERDFWSKSETLKFLSTYQKYKNNRKKSSEKQFWSIISSELTKINVIKSWEKCCIKWKNLCRTYKKNLTRNLTSDRRFMFFEEMDEVLNNNPATETEEDSSTVMLENMKNPYSLENEQASRYDSNESDIENDLNTVLIDRNFSDFWNGNETLKLIESYNKHKQSFEESSSNKPVWSVISAELACEGIYRDAEKCETEWKRLRTAYRTFLKEGDVKTKFLFANELAATLKNGTHPIASRHEMEGEESETEEIFENDNESWSSSEISTLIQTYGEHRNYFFENGYELLAWEQISAGLSLKNIHRTPEDCERKWKALYELYLSKKHKTGEVTFEFFNEIDTIFHNEQVKASFKDDKKRHKENCGCFERKMMEKSRRHQERMGMMKRKLDLEERKLLAFEKYLNYLKTEKD